MTLAKYAQRGRLAPFERYIGIPAAWVIALGRILSSEVAMNFTELNLQNYDFRQQTPTLGDALVAAAGRGRLRAVKTLYLNGNQLHDAGAAAIASQCARGMLPKLEFLSLTTTR